MGYLRRKTKYWYEKCDKRGHDISMCRKVLNTCKPIWFQDDIVPEGMALAKIEHNVEQSNGVNV